MIGFFATLGTGQAVFLIIPFIMTIILIIAGLRSKPKPVSRSQESSTFSDPVRKNNSPWQPKKGGPFEK
jgi:hypothetical protein